jgi:hypothetical protein
MKYPHGEEAAEPPSRTKKRKNNKLPINKIGHQGKTLVTGELESRH